MRPADCAMPKPEARALVGNTSEMKICDELPASWMKKIITNPTAKQHRLVDRDGPKRHGNKPASTNAATAVSLRPKRSSAIHHEARWRRERRASSRSVSQRFVDREAVLVARMLGSQAPSPSAMPKNAKKQIIPAITRRG